MDLSSLCAAEGTNNDGKSVTPAIAVQIYHSNKAFASTDFTFANWKAAIALQLVQCLSIVTVCIPSFNPLFNGLESGQIRIDDLRRQGKSGISSYPIKRPRYSGYRQSQISSQAPYHGQ
ncbi:hypothetical protein FOZG_17441 [Fusarium oxysporum Fo47]|uniref:Uncharacterized protein n=1 Tax=Fusarium oxysporum Fo47 TaxID=660027 RepID=W9JEK1_FUSOX|nr:hypothetical protein FOZG_17441 [Fusarium oxysporum Fo47]